MRYLKLRLTFLGLFFVIFMVCDANSVTLPNVNITMESTDDPQKVATILEILLLLTVLSVAPAILLMMTSFTRLLITFSFLRQALGTQQTPPNQVLIGLSLFLTIFIMQPVWEKSYTNGVKPYLEEKIGFNEALKNVTQPFKKFMLSQTRENDLALFVNLSKIEQPKTKDDIPIFVLIPAFVISELKTAFEIGFILFIPFLIIDMVVSSVLLSMGMMMLPPIMISLPFKLLLFVLVDGWNLLIGSLIKSFVEVV